jgi:hypothetical protein
VSRTSLVYHIHIEDANYVSKDEMLCHSIFLLLTMKSMRRNKKIMA